MIAWHPMSIGCSSFKAIGWVQVDHSIKDRDTWNHVPSTLCNLVFFHVKSNAHIIIYCLNLIIVWWCAGVCCVALYEIWLFILPHDCSSCMPKIWTPPLMLLLIWFCNLFPSAGITSWLSERNKQIRPQTNLYKAVVTVKNSYSATSSTFMYSQLTTEIHTKTSNFDTIFFSITSKSIM